LGCVEVSEPTNSKICRESFAKLYQEYKTEVSYPNSAILWITGYELRIVEKKSKVIPILYLYYIIHYSITFLDVISV